MATGYGSILSPLDRAPLSGTVRHDLAAPTTEILPNDIVFKLSGPGTRKVFAPTQRTGYGAIAVSPLEDTWFEKVHVWPRRIDLGNVLAQVSDTITVFNAFRDTSVTWTDLDEDAGSGISVSGDVPPPDEVIDALDAVVLGITIDTNGPPVIDGELGFTFFGLYTVPLPITGSRLVAFPFVPERPMRERLVFLTDVLEALDGSQQRVKGRGFPRQEMLLDFLLDEGRELTGFDNVVYDWQARVFGVPVWWEPTQLSSAASASDTVLNVVSTANADYRVGGLAAVFTDSDNVEILEVAAVTSTTVEFSSPITGDYSVGALVMPARTARIAGEVGGSRAVVGSASRSVRFRVTDNDVGDSFADASTYDTYDGYLLLDDPNAVGGGALREGWVRRLYESDGETGKFEADSDWPQSKRQSSKGFRPKNRAAMWRLRRLLHHISGRLVPFWLPTFYKDLVPAATVQGGTTALVIEEAGFSRFVNTTRPNRSVIRLEDTSGNVQIRVIQSASSLSGLQESITVSPAWDAGDLDVDDVARITLFELVCFASDTVEILHRDNLGQASVDVGVITVFDS